MSVIGKKIQLSMREVDQETGADLRPRTAGGAPEPGARAKAMAEDLRSNPARPTESGIERKVRRARCRGPWTHSLPCVAEQVVAATLKDDNARGRTGKKLSEQERWEITQLSHTGVVSKHELGNRVRPAWTSLLPTVLNQFFCHSTG